jgi:hypothetical protein
MVARAGGQRYGQLVLSLDGCSRRPPAWRLYRPPERRTVAAQPMTEEEPRMAMTLGKRKRAARPDAVTRTERAAMTELAATLRRLAAELPEDSLLAAEFTSVARSIDVTGVVGTWRLNGLAGEAD